MICHRPEYEYASCIYFAVSQFNCQKLKLFLHKEEIQEIERWSENSLLLWFELHISKHCNN